MTQPLAPEHPTPATNSARRQWKIVAVVLGAILLLAAAVTAAAYANRPSMNDKAGGACRNEVLQRLKSPATATFGPLSAGLESPEGVRDPSAPETRYLVVGSVDSQNGFGALVRTEFVCVMTVTGSGWRADQVVTN
jgi:hypothetical protein